MDGASVWSFNFNVNSRSKSVFSVHFQPAVGHAPGRNRPEEHQLVPALVCSPSPRPAISPKATSAPPLVIMLFILNCCPPSSLHIVITSYLPFFTNVPTLDVCASVSVLINTQPFLLAASLIWRQGSTCRPR